MGASKAIEHSRGLMAVLTFEAQNTASGYYHLLSEDETRSLCGNVNAESQFAAEIGRVLTEERAASRGFEVCGLCDSFADR